MQKMFVIHYRMLVTLVKMIYAVNSKIISMAMVAILKFLKPQKVVIHLCECFCGFHGNGSHFEISKSQNHLYTCHIFLLSFTNSEHFQFVTFFVATVAILKFLSLKIMCTHVRQNFWKVSSNSEHFNFFVVSMATAAILKIRKVVCTSTHSA